MIVVAGDPNSAATRVWEAIRRSFTEQCDGPRRLEDLYNQFESVTVESQKRYKVYPANDPRIMRIVRKIIRGLCYYHQLMPYVPDNLVWSDVLRLEIPHDVLDVLHYHHRDPEIIQYGYCPIEIEDMHSLWVLQFYGRTTFVGTIARKMENLNEVKTEITT
jgi:hypothetical protein